MVVVYFHDLIAVSRGHVLAEVADYPITEWMVDSRNRPVSAFPIFFAISGINHDGHDYLEEAYQQGIRQFVIDRHSGCSLAYGDINLLQVTHTVEVLQQWAAFYRAHYTLPLLGITGSHGKNVVKEWMHLLLSSQHQTISNPHRYNSQIGLPLAISLLQPHHTYAVFEAGISRVGEMSPLAEMMQPTHGLFTHIGPAHSQGFQSIVEKIEEKLQLFKSCNSIYYCQDDPLIHNSIQRIYGIQKRCIHWSIHNANATYIVARKTTSHTIALQLTASDKDYHFVIPFHDTTYLEYITHCLVYLVDNGLDPIALQTLLWQLNPNIPMRLTLKAGKHRCQLIEDSCLNDLTSLKLALDYMHQQHQNKQTIILPDGIISTRAEGYQALAKLLARYAVDRFIGIGSILSEHSALFSTQPSIFFSNIEDFLQNPPSFHDETILIKGVGNTPLGQIVRLLEKTTHSTILEIDMHAIRHNLSYFRTQLRRGTKIMAMVKASAYGSNDVKLAEALQRHNVDYLGVAYLDEGIRLRKQGIALPIMVMNPSDNDFARMILYQLEPGIYSLDLLEKFCNFITTNPAQTVSIHLKLETGMYRLGIPETALDQLILQCSHTPTLHVASIFSHLSGSESAAHDGYTLLQAERFNKMAEYIIHRLAIKPLKHLLNTNGFLRFPQYQFDMIRLGIGLYGVGVSTPTPLLAASKLKTTVAQVKAIPKGTSIGYNRQTIVAHDSMIATIAIGYADGLSRAFGCGKGSVMIQGRACPIVGEVCMDMAMVDVTGLQVKRGDEVVVFSAEHSIDRVAKDIGTISYELLTQIGQRVERIYTL